MRLQLRLANLTVRFCFGLVLGLNAMSLCAADSFPDFLQLPSRPDLPDPLVMLNGSPVTTRAQWEQERRPELKSLFQHYMYGARPPAPKHLHFDVEREDRNFLDGKATKKEIAISFSQAANAPVIHLLLVIPHTHERQAPATDETERGAGATKLHLPVVTSSQRGFPLFLGLNFCGNHTLVNDPNVALPTGWLLGFCPGCVEGHATDAGRGKEVAVWNIEQSIDRGYAVATFCCADIEPDMPNATTGLRAFLASHADGDFPSSDCATIQAWAWGLSRAVDYLIKDKDIDSKRISVVGHSRMGKAAILAAAFDERIALAVPLQAGCGGTAPSRGKIGESVKAINEHFPHWFNAEFKKFSEQPDRLPFDQECLIALVAPRPVLFGCATEDTWANPAGQFEMLQAADPVYRLLGVRGIDAKQMPEINQLTGDHLAYFIRPGKHSMTKSDWQVFLDFADKAMP